MMKLDNLPDRKFSGEYVGDINARIIELKRIAYSAHQYNCNIQAEIWADVNLILSEISELIDKFRMLEGTELTAAINGHNETLAGILKLTLSKSKEADNA